MDAPLDLPIVSKQLKNVKKLEISNELTNYLIIDLFRSNQIHLMRLLTRKVTL